MNRSKNFICYCHEFKGENKTFEISAECRVMAEGQATFYCYKNNLILDKIEKAKERSV